MNDLKTIDIKGKAYVLVNERLKYFRENFPQFSLISELLSNENGVCVIKASIIDENGKVLATGHASEKESSSFINKTSYIENCETSAWGRALANFGIGIDSSVASAEEVANAIRNQVKEPDRDFTEALQNAVSIDDIVAIWNSMTESEQAKFKGLASSMKQKIKEANIEESIRGLKKDGKTRPMIEEIIQKTTDKKRKRELIDMYNAKLQKLGINEVYEFTPFEEIV